MAITTPVSFWNLDESSGNAADAVGSNTLTNTGVVFTTGKIGNAADFERGDSTDVLSIADGSQSGLDFTNKMSISAWVNLESTPSNIGTIVSKWNPSAANNLSYRFAIDYDNDLLQLDCSGTGSNELQARCSWNPSTATWYHVVATYDGAATAGSRVKLYIDGASQTIAADNTPSSLFNSNQSFNIGNNGTNRQFDGLIDMVGVWNVVLTSTEVSELYKSGSGRQYPFVESFSIADTVTATDTFASSRARVFSLSDTVTATDAISAMLGRIFSALDTVTATDAFASVRARIFSAAETVAASEPVVRMRFLWNRAARALATFTRSARSSATWTRPDNPSR